MALNTHAIVGAFSSPIQPVRPSAGYMTGLAVSTVVVLMLPLIYIGIVAALGYGVVQWAIHGTFLFRTGAAGRLVVLKGVGYVTPLVAGAIVVLLAAKKVTRERARTLLEQTATVMDRNRERLDRAAGALSRSVIERDNLAAAGALIALRLKVPSNLVDGKDPDPATLKRLRGDAAGRVQAERKLVDEYCSLLARRFDAARAMIDAPEAAATFKDAGKVRRRFEQETRKLQLICRQRQRLASMAGRLLAMRLIVDAFETIGEVSGAANAKIWEIADTLRADLQALTEDGLVKDVPPGKEPFEVFRVADDAIDRAIGIARSAIGTLVLISDKVARACDLDPGERGSATKDEVGAERG